MAQRKRIRTHEAPHSVERGLSAGGVPAPDDLSELEATPDSYAELSELQHSDTLPTFVDRVASLIEKMRREEIRSLVPRPTQESPYAYSYPDACHALAVAPGREIGILQALADKGLFTATEVATVPLCPFCHTYPMRVERTCTSCGGTSVHRTTLIHHFRCGYVGAEETYAQGHELVCPKCNRKLLHLGVDYERPSEVWLCADCTETMPLPVLRYRSLTCGRTIAVGDELERTVYSYDLSLDAAQLADRRHLPALLEDVSTVDSLTGLPGSGSIERALELEQLRAERYGSTYSVGLLHLVNGEDLERTYGGAAVARVMKVIGAIVRESTRRVDTVGRYDQHLFVMVLPETNQAGAEIAMMKASASVSSYLHEEGRDQVMREARLATEVMPGDRKSAPRG